MAKHIFPKISGINLKFWKHDEQIKVCYAAIMQIEGPTWDRLAANDPDISDEIFAKLETTRWWCHRSGSWMCLIAKTGFPDRFCHGKIDHIL